MDVSSKASLVFIHQNLHSLSEQLAAKAEKNGIAWKEFSDFQKAVDSLKQMPPSLVLLEIMDDQGSISFMKKINEWKLPHLLIGASEKHAGKRQLQLYFRQGMHDHILLNENTDHIEKKIQNYLVFLNHLMVFSKHSLSDAKNVHPEAEVPARLKRRTEQLSKEIEKNLLNDLEGSSKLKSSEAKVRELNCIVQLSNLSVRDKITPESFIQESIPIIQAGFPNPRETTLEIKWKEKTFRSRGFTGSEKLLTKIILSNNRNIGSLSIGTKGEAPGQIALQEIKNFSILITRLIGQFIDQKDNENWLRKFQLVIDQSPFIIMFTDEKGNIEYVNPSFTKILGYKLQDIKGKRLDIAFFDNKHDEAYQQLKMRVSSGYNWHSEVKAVKANGSKVWTNSFISPIIEKENILGFVALIEDITERKELQAKFTENTKRYIQLANNINAGLGIYSLDGICKYVNKMGLINTRMTSKEIINKSIHQSFPKELAKKLQDSIDKVVSTGEIYRTGGVVKLENHQFYSETTVSPLFDDQGNISEVMFLTYDISSYKEIEQSLLIQRKISQLSIHSYSLNELLHKIFDTLLDIHWIDSGGIYIYDKKERLLKLEHYRNLSEEFAEHTSKYSEKTIQFQLVLKGDAVFARQEDVENSIGQFIKKEGIRFIAILPLFFDDKLLGCLNLGSFNITSISDNDKISIESIANVIANVIVKTEAFNLLKESNALLENTLNELHGKQQLLIQKSKLESLGELSSGIAHEINQPLSIIAMAIENMKIKWEEGSVSTNYMNDKFEQIFEYIEKIREIINHIRVFSRDQNSVRYDRIDIEKAIRKAISIIHQQYSNSHILIVIKAGNDIGHTVGNETQIEQVFLNLFSNSKYALLEKEGSLEPGNFKKMIEINISSDEKFIHVDFKDNGTGIPKDIADHVFNPFFTTKPETVGTGLGLSIVYGIMKEMNGEIEVTSEPGAWTMFRLHFPRFKKRTATTSKKA